MEKSISAAPNALEGNGGVVLVKVQSQKDSEMYRIAKVKCTTAGYHHTYRAGGSSARRWWRLVGGGERNVGL